MEVFSRLGMECYRSGFVQGFATAAILGFVVFMIRDWYNRLLRAAKPQAIMHLTARTPGQVFGTSVALALQGSGFLVVLLAVAFWRASWASVTDCAMVGVAGAVLLTIGFILSGLSSN